MLNGKWDQASIAHHFAYIVLSWGSQSVHPDALGYRGTLAGSLQNVSGGPSYLFSLKPWVPPSWILQVSPFCEIQDGSVWLSWKKTPAGDQDPGKFGNHWVLAKQY